MQNRKWIGPKLHERPQIVSPLSGPETTPEEEVKEVVKEQESVVEDKKTAPKENKKS